MNKNEKRMFTNKFKRINNIHLKTQSLFEPSDNSKGEKRNKFFSQTYEKFRKIPKITETNFHTRKFNLTKYTENSKSITNSKPDKETLDRIYYLKNIYTSEKFQKCIKNRPIKKESTLETITDYLVNFKKNNNELEGAMMAFYFVCHEIKYLKNNINYNLKKLEFSQKAENVFNEKKALSIGFTNLFEHFLKKMQINYKHVNGYCKLIPKDNSKFFLKINKSEYNLEGSKEESETDEINHCWNAIFINRNWYFVDTLLGSGGTDFIIENNEQNLEDPFSYYEFNFSPYYFMVPPKDLIITHRPSQEIWQFNEKTFTFKQFLNNSCYDFNQFYKAIYKTEVELLSHKEPIIKISIKETLSIKLRLKNSLLSGDIYNSTGKEKISELRYSYDDSDEAAIFEYYFPSSGEFILKINYRSVNSTDLIYWPLINYVVKVQNKTIFKYFDKYKQRFKTESVPKNKDTKDILPKLKKSHKLNIYKPKIISDYFNFFPSKTNKRICYDNEGFNLIEPKFNSIKKGTTVKFKLRMKGALNIAILDGNHLYYLKKTDKNIFEGEKEIKSENVSVCCLRGKHLFTEVFKFKSFKEKSIDSKLFLIKLKSKKI